MSINMKIYSCYNEEIVVWNEKNWSVNLILKIIIPNILHGYKIVNVEFAIH